nr:uncharacterized protein LOC109162486 [Ipomoea batatas]
MIWDDMLSLNKNEEIKVGIIDAWSAILNQKEKARSSSSPCRFFASTFVCLYTVVAPYGDDALRSKRFLERMDDEIKRTEGLNLQDIELFVFPIVHSEHYYVLNRNVKNKRFEILDNSSAESPKNEKMSWRDNNNKVDYGVFAMRHMETYMGKGTRGWDFGLEKENKEQLNNTRVKYLAETVNSPINEFREDCMKDSRQFEKASKAKKQIDPYAWLFLSCLRICSDDFNGREPRTIIHELSTTKSELSVTGSEMDCLEKAIYALDLSSLLGSVTRSPNSSGSTT